jgi:hypothetical protein
MLALAALACDAHSTQAAAAVTPRMSLPITLRAMPNLLLRVNRLPDWRKACAFGLHCHPSMAMQRRAGERARRSVQAAIMLIVIVAIVAMPPKATMPTTKARPAKTLLSMTLPPSESQA